MDQLAWSNGTKPDRSYPTEKPPPEIKRPGTPFHMQINTPQPPPDSINLHNAFSATPYTDHEASFRPCGHREEVYSKISERAPIERVAQNPFFHNNTNYIDHLNDQTNYLRPKSNYNTISSNIE